MVPYVPRVDELYAIFDHEIIMDVIMHKNQEIFVEGIDYMEGYIGQIYAQISLETAP